MKYFKELPLVVNSDNNGNYYTLKNLLIRTKLIPTLANNPLLFYAYAIQESDTPETIAYKYYGDQYRYWMVLIANEIMDPQWEWPLTSSQFVSYLKNKYTTEAGEEQNVLSYTTGTIHHYEKIITTIDVYSQTRAVKTVEIDEDTYTLLQPESSTNTFSDGTIVTINVEKNAISIYDYENKLNESKRQIKLINAKYVSQMETIYKNLVSA
jgi:hypothetical protein